MAKGDKTEAPTPKKKKDTRKKGQVAKSQDLAPWLALLVGTYVLPLTVGGLARAMSTSLAEVKTIGADPDAGQGHRHPRPLADHGGSSRSRRSCSCARSPARSRTSPRAA